MISKQDQDNLYSHNRQFTNSILLQDEGFDTARQNLNFSENNINNQENMIQNNSSPEIPFNQERINQTDQQNNPQNINLNNTSSPRQKYKTVLYNRQNTPDKVQGSLIIKNLLNDSQINKNPSDKSKSIFQKSGLHSTISRRNYTQKFINLKKNKIYPIQNQEDPSLQQIEQEELNASHIQLDKATQKNILEQIWLTVKKWHIARIFIRNMKDVICYREFWKLEKMHYELIGDKAWIQEANSGNLAILQVRDKLFLFLKFLKQYSKTIGVFSPEQMMIIIWKIFLFIFCFIELFKLPLKASFNLIFEDGIQFYLLHLTPLCMFLFEIILNFNTGYYSDGMIVMFWVDIINASTLAFVQYLNPEMLYVFFWFRVIQLNFTYLILDEHFQITQRYPSFWTLIKLIVQVLFVAHFVGCMFHSIAQLEISSLGIETWIHKQGIENEPWEVKYLYSLYFSLITMCTVGYGDISPVTNAEKIFSIISTIGSCGVFAYAINTIGSIFSDIQKKKENFEKQKFQITNYMVARQIDRNLQIKVLKYLDYIQDKERDDPKIGINILNAVSKNLREEVFRNYFCKILKKSPLFSDNFSDKCLEDVALNMQEIMFGPGEVIFKKGEADSRIYFIVKGSIEIYMETVDQKENKLINTHQAGSFLGQTGFLSGKENENSARSKNVSLLIYLNREDFEKVVKQFPQEYEKYCELKDDILLNINIGKIKCFSCQNEGHGVLQCPLLHLVIRKNLFLTHTNTQIFQPRSEMKRNNFKEKSLSENIKVKRALKHMRELLISEALDEDPPSDFENDIEDEDDYDFFRRCQKIEYEHGKLRIIDYYSDEDDDIDISSSNQSQDNREYQEDSQQSSSEIEGSDVDQKRKSKRKQINSQSGIFEQQNEENKSDSSNQGSPKAKNKNKSDIQIKLQQSQKDAIAIQDKQTLENITNGVKDKTYQAGGQKLVEMNQIQEEEDDKSSESNQSQKIKKKRQQTQEIKKSSIEFKRQSSNLQKISSIEQNTQLNGTIQKESCDINDSNLDDYNNMLMQIDLDYDFDPFNPKNIFNADNTFILQDDDEVDLKSFFQPTKPLMRKFSKKKNTDKKEINNPQNDDKEKAQNTQNINEKQEIKKLEINQFSPQQSQEDKIPDIIITASDQEKKNKQENSQLNQDVKNQLEVKQEGKQRKQSRTPTGIVTQQIRRGSVVKKFQPLELKVNQQSEKSPSSKIKERRQSTKPQDIQGFGRKQSINQGRKQSISLGQPTINFIRKQSISLARKQSINLARKQSIFQKQGQQDTKMMNQNFVSQILPGVPTQVGGLLNTRDHKQVKQKKSKYIENQIVEQAGGNVLDLMNMLQSMQSGKKIEIKKHGIDQELLKKQIENNIIPQKELFFYDMDQAKQFVNYNSHANYTRIVRNFKKIQKLRQLKKEQELLGKDKKKKISDKTLRQEISITAQE